MIDEVFDSIIHDEFEKIKAKCRNGYLLGHKVDEDNLEMFVVAAYMMGSNEAAQKGYRDLERAMDLFGIGTQRR